MHAADEPIHIVNVGLRSEASEHQSDTALAQKCYTFVQNKVSTATRGSSTVLFRLNVL